VHAAHVRCDQEYTSAIINFFLIQQSTKGA